MPSLPRAIWILAAGRLLSQFGSGFVFFYAPIFFVNQIGLSSALVGLGLGTAQQISGILGRILGGNFADSPEWGRRKTLLLSAAVSAIADVALILAGNFPLFLLGNLLMGLGIGLYWPATEAAISDLAPPEKLSEAYAITRLADSIGLSLGSATGGILLAASVDGRWLFAADGLSFIAFFGVIYFAIAETFKFAENATAPPWLQSYREALSDRSFALFVAVSILFTAFVSQTQTTLPLYLHNYIDGGLSDRLVGVLFSGHILLMVLLQLPIARWLDRFRRPRALMFSMVCWGLGFIPIWFAGTHATLPIAAAIAGLVVFSVAIVSYTPAAATLVTELAPERLRGTYLAINSLCWAVGYFIGPPLGGWALDSGVWRDRFWLIAALLPLAGLAGLRWLDTTMAEREGK